MTFIEDKKVYDDPNFSNYVDPVHSDTSAGGVQTTTQAAVADRRLHLQDAIGYVTTASTVTLKRGTTTLWKIYAAANTSFHITPQGAFRTDINEAMSVEISNDTGGAACTLNVIKI